MSVPARVDGDIGRVVRRLLHDGTPAIAVGSMVAGLAAYAFQVLGGRFLGKEAFAPVAALLSAHSLILAVLLTPVELLTVRRLALSKRGAPDEHDRRSIRLAVIAAEVIMVGFVAATLRRFFGGDAAYLVVGGAVVATHVVFALGRGALAGRERYLAYGVASGGAALLRLAMAGMLAAAGADDLGFAWAVVLPPLAILGLRPFRGLQRNSRTVGPTSGGLMAGFVLAGAISQAFVLAGPLVAGALDHDPTRVATTVSVVFVTFSLARAPLLLAQNLAARLLAGLSGLVARRETAELARWARRLSALTLLAALPAYLLGERLAPPLIEGLFGSAFRPSPTLAGLAVAACTVAAGSILLDQVLVAAGATGRLAASWFTALVVAGLALVLFDTTPDLRVAWAVTAGEVAALAAVMLGAEVLSADERDAPKRLFDLVVGGFLFVLSLPLQAAVALAIRLDSPGPVFHRQVRVGRDEKPFVMVKFRTMQAGASDEPLKRHLARVAERGTVRPDRHADGPRLWIEDEDRTTRVGKWLRRFSLDELPNLWNVLKGEMSLVGPRPLVPEEAALLDDDARRRHTVTPGMTGLAQINGASEATFAQRAYWDLRYVDERSLLLDLRILLATPRSAFRRR